VGVATIVMMGDCARADARPQNLAMHTSCINKDFQIPQRMYSKKRKRMSNNSHGFVTIQRCCFDGGGDT